MANTCFTLPASILILLIVSSNVIGLEEHVYHVRKTMQKRIDSKAILRELRYYMEKNNKEKHVEMMRRSMEDRISPGGPDPNHNKHRPEFTSTHHNSTLQ